MEILHRLSDFFFMHIKMVENHFFGGIVKKVSLEGQMITGLHEGVGMPK